MKKIGLCMIVKDEAAIICGCLNSVRPIIDYVLICDTGSTDNTKEVINNNKTTILKFASLSWTIND